MRRRIARESSNEYMGRANSVVAAPVCGHWSLDALPARLAGGRTQSAMAGRNDAHHAGPLRGWLVADVEGRQRHRTSLSPALQLGGLLAGAGPVLRAVR